MKKEEFEPEKKLEDLKHKNQLKQIEAKHQADLDTADFQMKCFIEVEKLKNINELSRHRLKRADIRRSLEARGKKY